MFILDHITYYCRLYIHIHITYDHLSPIHIYILLHYICCCLLFIYVPYISIEHIYICSYMLLYVWSKRPYRKHLMIWVRYIYIRECIYAMATSIWEQRNTWGELICFYICSILYYIYAIIHLHIIHMSILLYIYMYYYYYIYTDP